MIPIAFSDKYRHPLPQGHKFPMEKYTLIPEQLIYEESFSEKHFFSPQIPDKAFLERVHQHFYLEKLFNGTLSEKEVRRIGFPYSKSLIERETHICAGTTQAAVKALNSGASFNVAGGTHHAYADHGEGFCIFNDLAVAAMHLLHENRVQKVLIVDLDVHQGNGTASIFKHENRVFTFSMHGEKNYPLRKEKSDLDIALPGTTDDKAYLEILLKTLPKLIKKVKPNIIFYQSGVDILESDKLGSLRISKQACMERDKIVYNLAFQNQIPITASMGGGYSSHIRDIVDAHCNTFRVAKHFFE